MSEQEPPAENPLKLEEQGEQEPKAPLKFHIPTPGQPNPEIPSNSRVHLGMNLPEIKNEE